MLRIALQGSINDSVKLLETIRSKDNCIVSGLCTELEEPENEKNKLLDHPVQIFSTIHSIIPISDVVIFLEHTNETVPYVKLCLKESRHVFIYPVNLIRPETLKEYVKLAEEAGVILYLFHRPNLGKLENLLNGNGNLPEFIDIYRYVLPKENQPGYVEAVLRDEMLYLTSVAKYPVKKFKVATVPYYSTYPFIINVRIEFTNGSTANLTINTFTGLNTRFSEFYFSDGLIQVNTLEKNIRHRIWKTDKTYKYELNGWLNEEKDLKSEIAKFLSEISKISYPLNHYEFGYNIYNTIWELFREITPAGQLN